MVESCTNHGKPLLLHLKILVCLVRLLGVLISLEKKINRSLNSPHIDETSFRGGEDEGQCSNNTQQLGGKVPLKTSRFLQHYHHQIQKTIIWKSSKGRNVLVFDPVIRGLTFISIIWFGDTITMSHLTKCNTNSKIYHIVLEMSPSHQTPKSWIKCNVLGQMQLNYMNGRYLNVSSTHISQLEAGRLSDHVVRMVHQRSWIVHYRFTWTKKEQRCT